jgi:hypothetical protein
MNLTYLSVALFLMFISLSSTNNMIKSNYFYEFADEYIEFDTNAYIDINDISSAYIIYSLNKNNNILPYEIYDYIHKSSDFINYLKLNNCEFSSRWKYIFFDTRKIVGLKLKKYPRKSI